MPHVIMSKMAGKLEPSVKKKAYVFLEKLCQDDTSPGLHIEPITNSGDDKVRTGRVDQFYRAVLFRIPGGGDPTYVFHGIWPHDDAIAIARKTRLSVNPVNGIAEITTVAEPSGGISALVPSAAQGEPVAEPPPAPAPPEPSVPLLAVAADAVEWQGLALIDLASGHGTAEVLSRLGLDADTTAPGDSEAERLVRGLRHPAAPISFAWIEDNDELRRVIEGGDFAAWRVFLHPEQRKYVNRSYNGPFRLSGGAGTGKTVVLLHRTRSLAKRDPASRVLLTTFTTNLADQLRTDILRLDPALPLASGLGEP